MKSISGIIHRGPIDYSEDYKIITEAEDYADKGDIKEDAANG